MLWMVLVAFLILLIPTMSGCKRAIGIEILAGWMIRPGSIDHAYWALLFIRVRLSIDISRFYFKILVRVLSLPRRYCNSTRSHTEEASSSLMGLWTDEVCVERVHCSCSRLKVLWLVIRITSGPS